MIQVIGLIVGASLGVVILIGKAVIASIYTNIEEINVDAQDILVILAVYFQFECAMAVNFGILRGMAKTLPGTFITIISYYVISIPMQMFFAFHLNYGLHGLWYG